jgi:hypothetical protein
MSLPLCFIVSSSSSQFILLGKGTVVAPQSVQSPPCSINSCLLDGRILTQEQLVLNYCFKTLIT